MMRTRLIAFVIFFITLSLMRLADAGELVCLVTSGIIYVPKDLASIQEALNAAKDGDIISVAAAKYYEHIFVNKSVTLFGKEGTIIDGNGTGDVISVTKDNVEISGFTIQNGYRGIFISHSIGSTIRNSTLISHTWAAIELQCSNETMISGNMVSNSDHAIYLLFSSCSNTISDNMVTNNSQGLAVSWHCNGNSIVCNTLTSNSFAGIVLGGNNDNIIYHNNFINNPDQVYSYESSNTWDNGAEGNCWSDYTGVDLYSGPYQNIKGSDGIGDESYVIDVDNTDNYPLMGMFSDFNATLEYDVQTICNSLVSDFQFDGTTVHFNVTGEGGTVGFCRICIPTALMNDTFKVFVNHTEVPHTLLPCSNSTYSYLYFTYNHSTQQVVIIPGFPSFMILPLFMIATILTVIAYRMKHSRWLPFHSLYSREGL